MGINGKLEIKPIDIDAEMLLGIGVVGMKRAESGEQVLIDPMTKETVSKVAELDEQGKRKLNGLGNVVYEVNDHWFTLNAKFVWKDAPKQTVEKTATPTVKRVEVGWGEGEKTGAKKAPK